MQYRIEFETVNPISHPQYYHGERPAFPPAFVPEQAWCKLSRESDLKSIESQRQGLMTLIERGEYIRNVRVFKAVEPNWEEVK